MTRPPTKTEKLGTGIILHYSEFGDAELDACAKAWGDALDSGLFKSVVVMVDGKPVAGTAVDDNGQMIPLVFARKHPQRGAIVERPLIPAELRSGPCKSRPSLQPLFEFADWCPLELRKRVKAMAGDYDAEISRLHKDGRYPAARWNACLAWGYAVWYVFRAPADRIAMLLVKAFTGH